MTHYIITKLNYVTIKIIESHKELEDKNDCANNGIMFDFIDYWNL